MIKALKPETSLSDDDDHPTETRDQFRVTSPSLHAARCVLLLGLGLAVPSAAQEADGRHAAPMQVMADVALIDSRCQGVSIDFGALFRYGEENGIPAVAVLPTGKLRKTFEAAYSRRAATTSAEDLCTVVADEDDAAAPGVIRRP